MSDERSFSSRSSCSNDWIWWLIIIALVIFLFFPGIFGSSFGR